VSTRLAGLSAHLSEFRQHRGEEAEIRAEAELRHSVGEYTDIDTNGRDGKQEGSGNEAVTLL
jgi:hypothetical protein